ncbi:copper chaperone PCu(A)C [Cohaesibacter celericrescens]|uniref:copper chaperone PCu(A)C n=1 Tax=Cohaesibacter celericrescens TaxID=2067669 RepID=UPI0035679686
MKTLFAAALIVAASAFSAHAADWTVGSITVSDAFARATAGKASSGGSFLTIKNDGEADRLLAASADVGVKTELHTHIHEGDVMKMRQVDSIELPAKTTVALKPGGYHVMMMQLKAPLKKGESFPLELTFEKAGKLTVEVTIGGIGAKMSPEMDHSKMDHSKMDKSKSQK